MASTRAPERPCLPNSRRAASRMRLRVRSASRMRSTANSADRLPCLLQALLHGAREQAGVVGDRQPPEALLQARVDVVAVGRRSGRNAALDARGKRAIDQLLRRVSIAQCLGQIALADEHGIDAWHVEDALDVLDCL